MATTLVDGFYLNSAIPLDTKTHVADVTARNAIPALVRYLGMAVYCIAENKSFRLVGGILDANWQETTAKGVTVVADDTARDAIAPGDRTEGSTLVYVTATGKTWQLVGGILNANWKQFGSGGGATVVADYGGMLAIAPGDRTEAMLVYVQDEDELWQLRNGILDANWVNLDELNDIKLSALQTLTAAGVATLVNQKRQQIVVRGQVGGGTVFTLPNPSGKMVELFITGGSDDRTCVLATSFLGGGLAGNVASPGDIEFTLFKTVHFMADIPNSTWIQVGGW